MKSPFGSIPIDRVGYSIMVVIVHHRRELQWVHIIIIG